MGLLETKPTIGMVEALSTDIAQNPHFHEDYWQNINPNLRTYLETRAVQLQDMGADPATISLTLIVEISSFEERGNFEQDMEKVMAVELPSSEITCKIGKYILTIKDANHRDIAS